MSSRHAHSNTDGLLAALMEPASAYLRVAEPIRTCSAHDITLAVTTDQRCNSSNIGPERVSSIPSFAEDSLLSCKLCRRRMDNRVIFMYMAMGFCTEECRAEYYVEQEREYMNRYAMAALAAERRRARMVAREERQKTMGEGMSYRPVFFT